MSDNQPAHGHEHGVLVEISTDTHSTIEHMARATGVDVRRMLDRLIEHGAAAWHKARQDGRLSTLW